MPWPTDVEVADAQDESAPDGARPPMHGQDGVEGSPATDAPAWTEGAASAAAGLDKPVGQAEELDREEPDAGTLESGAPRMQAGEDHALANEGDGLW